MEKKVFQGQCMTCGGDVSKQARSLTSHLEKCGGLMASEVPGLNDALLLRIEGRYLPSYWTVVKIRPNVTLRMLDSFLRDYWVECCEHLSAFSFKHSEIPKARNVSQVFAYWKSVDYVYDFGSSTELKLSLLARIADAEGNDIEVMAHNKARHYACNHCESDAIGICHSCSDMGEGMLCGVCAATHSCVLEQGEGILTPIVNSPRVGVCGYTGSEERRIRKYFPGHLR